MISRFFINHPIFAIVISLVIMFAGVVAMITLPIEQYPNITPPLIQLQATYNGANAETIANDVASPLEQQIIGVNEMIYMYSQNSSSGVMTLDVYFNIGANADMAQVNVQNCVSQAVAQLPQTVQQEGIIITKQTPNILLVTAIQNPQGNYTNTFVSNYANVNIVNELELIPGISNIVVIGQRNYAMRIWLKPNIMAQLGITPNDVITAIQQQNADFGLGQLGQAPNIHPVELTIPFASLGRLTTPEQFENIILRANLDGAIVTMKDIATVTLGAQDYTLDGELNNESTIFLLAFQEFGANAIQVAESIRKTMAKLEPSFPEGIVYSIPYDSTEYIHASISEVIHTIVQASILVILVVFLFLQKWRAALIPAIALVVAVIGTFAGMYVLGYSINTLTLFGIVLAIGIVVDDAIVVVEKAERNIKEGGLSSKEGTLLAMEEVTGPIIAIVFVLCAVFIPVAFLGGIAGQLYRQFALTIAVSVVVSGVVALTFSPAIAAIILKHEGKEMAWARWFNKGFEKLTDGYLYVTRFLLQKVYIGLIIFAFIVAALILLFVIIPTSFLPEEDQGFLIAFAMTPDGASLNRTYHADQIVQEVALAHPGVEHVIALTGYDLLNSVNRTTVGTNFIVLKNWDKRKKKKLHASSIAKELNEKFYGIPEAEIFVANPPAIPGIGTVGGLSLWIENHGAGDYSALQEIYANFAKEARKHKAIGMIRCDAQFDNLQYYVDLNRYKTKMLGVQISDVFQALQTLVGSVYVNNFNKWGRVYQVIVQAEPSQRETLTDLGNMYVRSENEKMVPLNSLMTIEYGKGSNMITRFNDFPAVQVFVIPAPGYTTGQVIKAVEELVQTSLPVSAGYGWSGMAYEQVATGGSSGIVLIAGLIMVFLILSALYERWSIPVAILLAIPFGGFGAFVAIKLAGMPNDIYFQIGLVTLIALSAKNAILIVEFAMNKCEEGASAFDAALEAARLRFRPIVMTSLTFIFGVLPLVIAQGAGAASRHSVGMGVMGGMISATTLALFFVPLFFKLLYREKKQ